MLLPVWWRISAPRAPLSSRVTLTTPLCFQGEIPALLSASHPGLLGSAVPSLTVFFLALCDSNWAVGGTRVGEGGGAFPNRWGFTSVGSTLLALGVLELS